MKGKGLGRRALTTLVLLLLAAGVVIAALAGAPQEGESRSVTSASDEGRLAARLLLEALDFEPEIWRQAPLALPHGEHVLWLPDAPLSFATARSDAAEEGTDPADEREQRDAWQEWDPGAAQDGARDPAALPLEDPRHPAHYGRFVRAGGTLVLPARPQAHAFAEQACRADLPALEPGRTAGVVALQSVHVDGLEVAWDAPRGAPAPASDEGVEPLLTDAGGEVFASSVAVGHGRVVFLSDDAFLANAAIGEHDHALLLVRLVEELGRGGRLLFDEYALGAWEVPGRVELAFSPALMLLSLHLLAFLLLLLWLHAWVREFPRDPEPWDAISPLVRARAQARLLERARRHDMLAGMLRRSVLDRCLRLLRLPRVAGANEEAQPADVRERVQLLARACGRAADAARWQRAFAGPLPRDEGGLRALADELEAVEAAVERELEDAMARRRSA